MLNYAYTIEYSMCKCILSISSTFHCNYVPILYCFWGNQLSTRVMTCSWNSGLGVIKNGTIRQIAYELLLFHIHSNYGHILYHFRDKAKYWSKIAIFSYRICIHVPIKRDPIGISTYFVWKTSIVGLPGSERSLRIHRQNTRTWRTSRQSNSTLWHRPHHAYSVARQKLHTLITLSVTRSSAVVETARRCVSLNISPSHSRSFEMTPLNKPTSCRL